MSQRRYAQPVQTPAATTVSGVGATQSADDQVTTYTYTALNQLSTETAPDGTVTRYTYDANGHVTEVRHAAGTADERAGVFVASGEPVDAALGDAAQVAFLYPGQGSQRPGMTSDLFVHLGGLADLLEVGEPWLRTLFPPTAFAPGDRAEQQAAITATNVAQPTLGIASLAITRVLRRLGIEPDVAGGHSYGELAALAAAGSFDERTLLELSAARGDAILAAVDESGGDPGTMAAVELTREECAERLAAWPDIVLANHNGPKQAVISGPTASVQAAAAALEAAGTKVKLLPVACAFHSPVIARAGELLAERLASVPALAPRFPVWSNVTAEPYPAGDASAIAPLLAEQVTTGVRFVDQVESMYAAGVRTFVEAGPGRVLTQQVGKILGDRPHRMVATDVAGEHGVRRFLLAIAELATLGLPVDATSLFAGRTTAVNMAARAHAGPSSGSTNGNSATSSSNLLAASKA